jgi:hypothetical protein
MALTIRQITDDQIEMAKAITGKGTASGAVVGCIDIAQRRIERCIAQDAEILALREQLAHSRRVLDRLASAADETLTIVRQKDLLESPAHRV